ncbi:MAG: dihydroneopterin aldolase [Flavobacteriales bacterium]|nr:dihydroneopterin aldolase [Flavobacteriales bacterium]
MGKIFVEGIKIYAYHGCFKEEADIGTNFQVDVVLDADLSKPAETDDIADAVNYQAVFTVIKEQMAIRSNLLENVSKRITTVLFQEFPEVTKIKLKISKLNVPLGGHIDNVAIQTENERA